MTMKYNSAHTSGVYDVDPMIHKYVGDFDKSIVTLGEDRSLHEYVVWPLNLEVALFSTTPGSTIYYCDAMNGDNKQAEKESMPRDIHKVISMLGKTVEPIVECNPEIEVLLVPRQARGKNDCGP